MQLIHGDCLEKMAELPADSVDAIVTDPPYGLGFMGKDWDHGVPGKHFWQEALRVAKPGAHLLAFGGTRTFHRLACAIEDAGWQIRDTLGWLYGSGFPKSLNVGKAIDKAAGAEREVVGRKGLHKFSESRAEHHHGKYGKDHRSFDEADCLTAPATDAAKQWDGWGTALKPAWEPIIVARKPLIGTVANNVLTHGTGGLNIDGCRVGADIVGARKHEVHEAGKSNMLGVNKQMAFEGKESQGRFPANIIHDGSDEVLAVFPQTGKGAASGYNFELGSQDNPSRNVTNIKSGIHFGDSGSAARFFYCAKASKADRDEGCEALEAKSIEIQQPHNSKNLEERYAMTSRNHHPTVKPTALMRYLCKLVTPPHGIILDPFMGSGSTGKAAVLEGFRFIGIEKEAEYIEIARSRISGALPPLFR